MYLFRFFDDEYQLLNEKNFLRIISQQIHIEVKVSKRSNFNNHKKQFLFGFVNYQEVPIKRTNERYKNYQQVDTIDFNFFFLKKMDVFIKLKLFQF